MINWRVSAVCWSFLLIITAILTGCGGGGSEGSGASSNTPVIPSAPNWGAAVLIESDNTGDAANPQIAIDSTGNAIAVWEQFDGTRNNIKANRYTAGVGWGVAVTIESGSGSASNPQIAIDSTGNAIAVWEQFDGTRNNIKANRYTAGTGWGVAVTIESGSGSASNPQIAIDSAGNAIAVWEQFDGARFSIFANRYIAGMDWGLAEAIDSGSAGSSAYPRIAMNSGGDAVVVWEQWNGARDSIRANRYVGGWGVAEAIDSGGIGNTGSSNNAQVAIDSSGSAVAVWEQSSGGWSNIRANQNIGGSWGTAQLIETSDGNAYLPKVAMDSGGNAIAVWEQFDGVRYSIRSCRYTGGWGVAVTIDSGGAGNTGESINAQIAMAPGGSAISVWEQFDGSIYNIRANRYAAGWGIAQLIESYAGDALLPRVAMDASGNAVAVWEQDDGSTYSIMSNRYAGGWGTAGLIESGSAGLASNARVSMNASGSAVAVWEQFDGSRMSIWSNRRN